MGSQSRRMGDHLALLVDHLLTESTLEAAIGSRKQGQIATDSASLEDPGKEFTRKRSVRDRASAGKLVECRICQEEDEDCNLEIPCSCCGSLKYAHRKCVQRWCNEKGDTVCEICLKEFQPDYTAPPKLFHYGSIPMNFRGNWEITREDFNDSRIITLFPSEPDTMRSSYDDLSALSTRGTVCCQSVAITVSWLQFVSHFALLCFDRLNDASSSACCPVHVAFAPSPYSSSHDKWNRAAPIRSHLNTAVEDCWNFTASLSDDPNNQDISTVSSSAVTGSWCGHICIAFLESIREINPTMLLSTQEKRSDERR
ncbi:hypothetical protein MUK42_15608 [Musa troglodytarum]|uniref:RING-CH-type domain-containing protein n=1 Tax=Musa troglodytarum TaxID=320322 RepID=A0A9E7HHS4_9LILI|nr:hypothetical protein MUK42_15608 [Musa troglodytarum]